MRSLVFAIGFVLFSNMAVAAEVIQINVSKSTISTQRSLVLNALNDDVKYSEISSPDRASVVAALDRIAEILTGDKSIAPLDAAQQHKIEQDQEAVNKILAKAFRDSRLVCSKEPVLGTNMIKRICKTAAARKRDSDFFRDNGFRVEQ